MLPHRIQNDLPAWALNGGMAMLLGFTGYLLFGATGLLILVIGGACLIYVGSGVTPQWVSRMHKAKPVKVEKDIQFSVLLKN